MTRNFALTFSEVWPTIENFWEKNSRKFFLSFQEGFLSRFTGPYACKSSISDRFQPVSAQFQAQFCIHAWIFWSLARTQDLMHALCMADRKRNGEQRARRMRAFLRHALFCYLFWGRIRIPGAILVLVRSSLENSVQKFSRPLLRLGKFTIVPRPAYFLGTLRCGNIFLPTRLTRS